MIACNRATHDVGWGIFGYCVGHIYVYIYIYIYIVRSLGYMFVNDLGYFGV